MLFDVTSRRPPVVKRITFWTCSTLSGRMHLCLRRTMISFVFYNNVCWYGEKNLAQHAA